MTTCETCGTETVAGARGRKPRFCGTRCRVAGHRRRVKSDPVPLELRELDRWIRHSNKRPMSIDGRWASVVNETVWASYEEAVRSDFGDGVGFVLNGDGVVCVDLDDCVVDGVISKAAQNLLDSLPVTYVEKSPSGRGLHVWGRCEMSAGRRFEWKGLKVEVYPAGRYLTVTGNRVAGVRLADLPLADVLPV
jgi:primase-polymerase (primpol)-like protein